MSEEVQPFIKALLDRAMTNLWYDEDGTIKAYLFKPARWHSVQLVYIFVSEKASSAEIRNGYLLARACDRHHSFWCLIHQDAWTAIERERETRMDARMNMCILQLQFYAMCFHEVDWIERVRTSQAYIPSLWASIANMSEVSNAPPDTHWPLFIIKAGRFLTFSSAFVAINERPPMHLESVRPELNRALLDPPVRKRKGAKRRGKTDASEDQDPPDDATMLPEPRSHFTRLAFKQHFRTPPLAEFEPPRRPLSAAPLDIIPESIIERRGTTLPRFPFDESSDSSPEFIRSESQQTGSIDELSGNAADMPPPIMLDGGQTVDETPLRTPSRRGIVQVCDTPLDRVRKRSKRDTSETTPQSLSAIASSDVHSPSTRAAVTDASVCDLFDEIGAKLPLPPPDVILSDPDLLATRHHAIFAYHARSLTNAK